MENINKYYESQSEWNDKMASRFESQRELLNELGRNADENGNLIPNISASNYKDQISRLQKMAQAIKNNYEN